MSVYFTRGSLQRLQDQALLADYATDTSTQFHLDQFREEMTRLLSGASYQHTSLQARQKLKGQILETLAANDCQASPAAADALIERLINQPISDPLLNRIPPAAIATEQEQS